MAKKKRYKASPRAEPQKRQSQQVLYYTNKSGFEDFICHGYTTLANNPEIITAVNTIGGLIGSMTIHLMQSTEDGDVRVKNELSRRVDINPNKNMTRSSLMQWIVRTMFIEGDGNAIVYPRTEDGYIRELIPIPASQVAFIPYGQNDYRVAINGVEYEPDDVLHFRLNPSSYYPWKGDGLRVPLSTVAGNLQQASATEKGFMQSNWKPSLIVKVDAMVEEFSSPEARRKLLDQYVSTTEAGEPWLIPANELSVEQVKPLTLADLALSDMVELDKRTVASILGVPAFVLGVGDFSREAWNNFISSKIMICAKSIEQELTKKILYSPDYYWRFNSRSLYNYDLKDLSDIATNNYSHGIMTGNEVRDWIGLSPLPELNKLVILENYIPADRIGDQEKLNGGEQEGGNNDGED